MFENKPVRRTAQNTDRNEAKKSQGVDKYFFTRKGGCVRISISYILNGSTTKYSRVREGKQQPLGLTGLSGITCRPQGREDQGHQAPRKPMAESRPSGQASTTLRALVKRSTHGSCVLIPLSSGCACFPLSLGFLGTSSYGSPRFARLTSSRPPGRHELDYLDLPT